MLTTVTTAGEGYIYTLSKTIRRFSLVHGRTKNRPEALLPQTDRTTRCQQKNIVSDRNKLYDDKSTMGYRVTVDRLKQ